ncbi:LpxI family protein [Halovulum sp. GXIMD14793]
MPNPEKAPKAQAPLAIVAGQGDLPRLIAEERARQTQPYRVVQFEGTTLDWLGDHPVIKGVFEKPGRLFSDLRKAGCNKITFAGGMRRPRLSPLRFDLTGIRLAPKLFSALRSGDDAALRTVSEIFEAEGLDVVGAHELLSGLLVPEGVLGKVQPTDEDRDDAARAAELVAAIGAVDAGQGAVVAQGICLGLESIQGTDAMLEFVATSAGGFRPDPEGAQGVLLKAPKPGQDWRVDLPAIGLRTVELAHAAGLSGLAVQANAVLVLGLEETIAKADELGLFLWGRPA